MPDRVKRNLPGNNDRFRYNQTDVSGEQNPLGIVVTVK
jgi:hypothetical protein